ncbi:MAG: toprim domain-containing protein [Halobacteriota archaeon]|nr:toprim domain-containing protein [Halobacteriota archaeon]
MDATERLERVERIIDELKEVSRSGAVIIVEGKRDRRSLEELGVEGHIVLATYFPLLSFAENISCDYDEAVIMTDWDLQGEKLAIRISSYLYSLGTRPNNWPRRRLGSLVRKEITAVEDLFGYVERLKLKTLPQHY